MRERFTVAAHLSADALAARYRAASDPVPRGRLHMVWLLVAGRPLAEVAAVAGYSTRWVREVVKRDHAPGPDGLAWAGRPGRPAPRQPRRRAAAGRRGAGGARRGARGAAARRRPGDLGQGRGLDRGPHRAGARGAAARLGRPAAHRAQRRTGHSGAPGTAAGRPGRGTRGRRMRRPIDPGPPPPGRSFQKA